MEVPAGGGGGGEGNVNGDSIGPDDRFKTGDRAFAKMKGYAPWPARVFGRADGSTGREHYFVHFFGTYDISLIRPEYMYEYNDRNLSKFGKPKRVFRWKEAMEEIRNDTNIDDRPPISMKRPPPPPSKKLKVHSNKVKALTSKRTQASPSKATRTSSSSNPSTPSTSEGSAPLVISRSGRKIRPKPLQEGFVTSDVTKRVFKQSTSTSSLGDGGDSSDDLSELPSHPLTLENDGQAPILEGSSEVVSDGSADLEPELQQEAPPMLSPVIQASEDVVAVDVAPEIEDLFISDMQAEGTDHVINMDDDKNDKMSSFGESPAEAMVEKEEKSDTDSPANHDLQEEASEEVPTTLKNPEEKEHWETPGSIYESVKNVTRSEGQEAVQQFKEVDDDDDDNSSMDAYDKQYANLEKVLLIERGMMETFGEIVSCLGRESDVVRASHFLEKLGNLEVTKLMLLKHPEVVANLDKLRRYVGSKKKLEMMSRKDAVEFKGKARKFRETALEIYEKFHNLFLPSKIQGPNLCFEMVFDVELKEFKKKTQGLSKDEIIGLIRETENGDFEMWDANESED